MIIHAQEKRRKGFTLSPNLAANYSPNRVWLFVCVANLFVAGLIAVVTVEGTNACRVFVPIVISDNTYIRRGSVRVQVLVGIRISLDRGVPAIAGSSESNYRHQTYT